MQPSRIRQGLLILCLAWPLAAKPTETEMLTIERVRRLAAERNHTLQNAKENLYQAEILIDRAWSMVKPRWDALGTYTHYNTEASLEIPRFDSVSMDPAVCGGQPFCFTEFDRTEIQKQDTFGFATTLTQPLFVPRAISTIQNAKRGYQLARINAENLGDFVAHNAEVAYYGVLTMQKLLDTARESMGIRSEHLRIARARFETGDEPRISVIRAQIEVNRAEQDVRRAQSSLALAQEALGLLIDRVPPFELSEPDPPQPPAASLEDFIDRALHGRRDLTAARIELEMGQIQKDDAWYRFLPGLVATGSLRVSDSKGFYDSYLNWSVGVAISIPIYEGGLRGTYLDEARSKIRQAEIKLDGIEKAICSEIRQLWLRMEMAAANLEKARRALELAREQAQLAKLSYQQGASSNLELLDANAMLSIFAIAVAQEELSLQLAILRLKKSVHMFDPGGADSGTRAASPEAGR